MSRFILDTSVAVAWYLPEVFAESARTWQSRMVDGRIELVVPSLHFWEFANVLRTHVRDRTLDAELASEIWALHLDAPLQVIEPPTESVLKLALEYHATAYDAVYIALAVHLDVPLLTAERSSAPWVKKLAKRVQTIGN
jgi:predicted nucleic acid-binding protein